MKRAIIIVLDSVGIGELPDAADFGDVGSNTLVNIKKVRPQTSLPNLCALGLGDIQGKDVSLLGEVAAPKGCYGKMAERSIGKDTTTGHWEMAGIITKRPFPTFTETGFPKEVMDAFEAGIGTKHSATMPNPVRSHSGFRRGAHENRVPHRLYLCGQRVPDCGT